MKYWVSLPKIQTPKDWPNGSTCKPRSRSAWARPCQVRSNSNGRFASHNYLSDQATVNSACQGLRWTKCLKCTGETAHHVSVGQVMSCRVVSLRACYSLALDLVGATISKWPGSSVGRAEDWKSLCRWFDSAPGHHTLFGLLNIWSNRYLSTLPFLIYKSDLMPS